MTPESPQPPYRVLFVCMGNICRSPAAENVFRQQVADAGRSAEFYIDSAGTLDYHEGSPPDPRMARTLKSHGYPADGFARPLKKADLENFDWVLYMDDDNRREINRLDRDRSQQQKIRPFVEYCSENHASHVPDPYQGGQEGFELVLRLIEDAGRGLLASLPSRTNS
ncbi:low molecular weight phosphotyrosine protein phosphatase [Luteolibacter pohnpeiensis]|uniref:Low molecular weight phosphotyrosine protein phosphatase n=1 Tax=Luteolibacter pohnpeiensis TaxID=454153 RepID=A0A934S5Y2_9BACT|nr:low molecular weight protein-tyrosine-phosphatase [Luteolibacter pohnpeiensis]MBK1881774.1 low molecular weight phosphotyrosine protein phosphatase [Luteolibacter pohnpeiensis]